MLNALTQQLSAWLKGERPPKAGLRAQKAETLLAPAHRQALLTQIRQMVSLPLDRWLELYQTPLYRFAALVQELPASEVHHHSGRGGMLDHSLEAARNALKIRQGYVLPKGATPEQIQPLGELYSYAVFSGTLLHDIGKIIADQTVTLSLPGQPQRRWLPWEGAMPPGAAYQIRFNPERQYRIHERLPLLLANQLLPTAGLSWLASDTQVWAAWVLAVTGELDAAGPVGEIIGRADRSSVARNLGAKGTPVAAATTTKPLELRLLTALRFLLHEGKLTLNRKGAAGWLTPGALWLVSKPAVDALRAHLIGEGHTGIPSENARLFDILQEHGLLMPNGDKAIWHCVVDDAQGWRQPLTMLRFEPSLFWPPDRMPPPFAGTVSPDTADAPSAASAVQMHDISSEVAIPELLAPSESRPSATAMPPLPSLAAMDGILPLPPGMEPDPGAPASSAGREGEPPPAGSLTVVEEVTTESQLGERFLAWLRNGIDKRHLVINDASAKVHTVAGGVALVSPGIFQRFAAEQADVLARFLTNNPSDKEGWMLVQKAFQKQGLHQRTAENGENIRQFQVKGPRKETTVKGYFLPDARTLFDVPPPDNPHIMLKP